MAESFFCRIFLYTKITGIELPVIFNYLNILFTDSMGGSYTDYQGETTQQTGTQATTATESSTKGTEATTAAPTTAAPTTAAPTTAAPTTAAQQTEEQPAENL